MFIQSSDECKFSTKLTVQALVLCQFNMGVTIAGPCFGVTAGSHLDECQDAQTIEIFFNEHMVGDVNFA